MKILSIIVTLILLTTVTIGQTRSKHANPPETAAKQTIPSDASYSFKDNYLGMSLEEFRKLNKRADSSDILCSDNSPELRAWLEEKNKDSDAMAKQLGMSMNSHDNITVCPVTGGSFELSNFGNYIDQSITRNDALTTEGHIIIPEIEYEFFESKLWKISIGVTGWQWRELADVLKSKYGAPLEDNSSKEQNASASTRESPCLVWMSKNQKIWAYSPGLPQDEDSIRLLPDSMIDFIDTGIGDKLDPPKKSVTS